MRDTTMRWARRALLLLAAPGLLACDGEAPGDDFKLSREGESCTRSADCEGDLGCSYQRCVDRAKVVATSSPSVQAYAPRADRVPQLR